MATPASSLKICAAGLTALLVGASLAACNGQAPAGSSVTATPAAPGAGTSDADVKAREAEIAKREAEVAQREAAIAAREQDQAREKDEAATAAKATADAKARDAAAKADAKAAAARKAASKSPPKSTSVASAAPPKPAAPPPPLRMTVPGGSSVTIALSSDLSTKTAQPGDTFEATVAQAVRVNDRVVVPIGTRVTGTITDVISGSRSIGATPTLGFQFNQLVFEDGQTVPITGELQETGHSEKVQDSAKILGGAAAGAVLGHQVKSNNRGKIIGGLLGGAIGAVAAKKTGSELQLTAGSQLTLSTGEPFTVTVHDGAR